MKSLGAFPQVSVKLWPPGLRLKAAVRVLDNAADVLARALPPVKRPQLSLNLVLLLPQPLEGELGMLMFNVELAPKLVLPGHDSQ
jgi:hypothetical protein